MKAHYDKLFYFDRYVVTRLQSGNWEQDVSDEDIEEIGNSGIVETIIDPIIPTPVSMSCHDWGATDPIAQVFGNDSDLSANTTGYSASAGRNSYSVSSEDLRHQNTDIVVRVADHDTGNLERTVWIPNCRIDSINWSYSVDGNATEDFSFTGDTDRHFFGKYKEAMIDIGTVATDEDDHFDVNTDESTSTYTGLYVTINGDIYDFSGNFTWSGTVVTKSGTPTDTLPTLATGDRVRLFYYKTTPSDTFTELDTSGIGALKGAYIEIEMSDTAQVTGTDGTYTLKLQSCDISATVTREDLREIGNYNFIGRPVTKTEVDVDVTSLEDDLENFAYMLGATTTQWTNRNTSGLERKLQDSIGNSQKVQVRIYDTYTKSNLLKKITLTDLRLTRSPFSQDVGGNGQVSFSLKGDNFLVEPGGSGAAGRLASSYPTAWIESAS